MKSTSSFYAAMFLLLLQTTSFGQYNAFSQQVSNLNEMDTFPNIILNLVDRMANEIDLSQISQNIFAESDDFEGGSISVDIVFEIEYTKDNKPSIRNSSIKNTNYFNNPSFSAGKTFLVFSNPINFSNDLNYPFSRPINDSQNFPKVNYKSVVHVMNTIDRVELEITNLNINNRKSYNNPTSSLGNWQFKIGPDKNSSYTIPHVPLLF
ncbi:MAG: hypothetical protein KJP00_09835 [Bacteroidia bacterium]|nr:hypothetical protein [Bacteroidia bacterium]